MEFTNVRERSLHNDAAQAIPHTPDTLEELVSFLGIDVTAGVFGEDGVSTSGRKNVTADGMPALGCRSHDCPTFDPEVGWPV